MARKLAYMLVLAAFASSCSKPAEAPAPAASTAAAKPAAEAPKMSYEDEIAAWKKGRIERLTSESGWLTVVGLQWLAEGENTVGSDPASNVALPRGKTAAHVGSIFLEKGKARIVAKPEAKVTSDGKPVTAMDLAPDTSGKPTTLAIGPVSFFVIERGGKFAVRVKDSESDARKNFKGIDSYPVDPKWRVEAQFTPYDPVKKIPITNVLGQTEPYDCPGRLTFTVDGKSYSLDPVLEEKDGDLFIIFGDTTNRSETYGAGRFLYAKRAGADGKVIVDFNKAYNPPCVFTPFATCPLPPAQNKLDLAITAGEKRWGNH